MPLERGQKRFWNRSQQTRQGRQRINLTALGAGFLVIAVRFTGLLQIWELTALDQLMQVRPPEPQDDRIVIVSIDEKDLQSLGHYPMPDDKVAQLLEKLRAARPRVIGMDIYRNLPVEPGHQVLRNVYRHTPNLIGIEHFGDEDSLEIPAPPVLKDTGQYGFNNLVHDQDDRVRRGLLYSKLDKNQQALPSFSLTLALHYLKAEGIEPQTAADGSGLLQLGNTVFRRFMGNDGSYTSADDGGYQILFNPRGAANHFRQVSLMEVLQGQVDPAIFRDRIVLIGYTAISLNDFVFTSYSSQLLGAPEAISGVELHANLVSQIIQTALHNRPLIQTWPEPMEWIWILLWAWLGAIFVWKLRSPYQAILAIGMAGLSLVLIGYIALLSGWWIPVVTPMLALSGAAIGIAAHTARLQEELRRSKEFLNSIINTIPDPIFVKDKNHHWIVLNEAYARLLGYSLEELLERSDNEVFSQTEACELRRQDNLVFQTGKACQSDESFTDRYGNTHQIETKRSLHQDAAGNLFLVGVMRDITERKQMEDELKRAASELIRSNAELQQSASQLNHLVNHDSLTGLPNRKLFYERLQQALDWAKANHQRVGLCFLDLDGFKQINDSRGHDIGDLLLQSVAQRLTRCLRASDTVARLGGDEFTIILPAIPGGQHIVQVAKKLLHTLSKPFLIQGQAIAITSSIGISIYPDHAQDLDTLMKQADHAMYLAKQQGKSRYEISHAPTLMVEAVSIQSATLQD